MAFARRRALGIEFDLAGLDAARAACAARDPTLPFATVVTPHAVHVVRTYQGEQAFIDGISAAWLVICDSRVVRSLVRLSSGIDLPLATGSDLTVALLRDVIDAEDPVTVIGGDAALAEALRRRFGLRRLVQHIPPMGFIHDAGATAACVNFVQENPGRFVFLACGAPQSELLGARIAAAGGATGVGLCIGASLLFATGRVRRAPSRVQKLGLEWLFRLAQEPRRLWRRLLTGQLPLLWVALRYRLRPQDGTIAARSGPRARAWPG